MNILFVGDVVGKVGRKALKQSLPFVKEKYDINFTIVNGENITNGRGMNKVHYDFLKEIGVDCVTLGNHYKDKTELAEYIDKENDIVRPLNLKCDFPGEGSKMFDVNGVNVRVSNVLGVAFMKEEVNDPYEEIAKIIEEDESDIHIIDFHADSTGEKKAFAYSLKNTVTAVVGTHTHVQTNDAQILNTGVGYITDIGMCGSYNSVLGSEIESVVKKVILHEPKTYFKLLEDDDTIFNAVVLKIDDMTFTCKEVLPINILKKKE